MKLYLISDNVDTLVGMRLAGIEGEIVHEEKGLKEAIKRVSSEENIAIILITEKLVEMCRGFVYGFKLKSKRPLIVEIPDRHSNGSAKNSITKYIQDAVGIKI